MRCPTCKRTIVRAASASTGTGASTGTPEGDAFLPFCSQRCKLADLHGWLSGSYVVSEALPFDETEGRPLTSEEE